MPTALGAAAAMLALVAVSGPAGASCDGATVLVSPGAPAPGGPLRVLAASGVARDGVLAIHGADGERLAETRDRHGGSTFWWYVEATAPRAGSVRVTFDGAACEEVRIGAPRRPRDPRRTWPVEREWGRGVEELYAAWVEKLFDVPLDVEPAWRALHEVTRDRSRNALHDHLGLGEDDPDGLVLEPDCADLPYFLRAYFAWKLGLPFAFSECSRGGEGAPPRCGRRHTNLEAPPGGEGELGRMRQFFARRLAWVVQSGAARVPADTDQGDFYPTRLTADALRPGTVFADPYGHVLVVVHRVPQTAATGGRLLAVDAQPDGTVARKRFWRGTFLFAVDPALGSAGFKHFRPLVTGGGGVRALGNEEIAADPDLGDYSLEQYATGATGFYDRIDELLSPAPRDPVGAFRETIDALDEQIRTRIRSVANGEEYVSVHPGVVSMPEGSAIFETTGPWEDFSTPSRDLRLLIAIDVVRGFPAEVARRPARFVVPAGRAPADVVAELEALLASEGAARRFQYVRSDGSPWTLTLANVLERAEALEVAYDPNDCVEVRWGAPANSTERSTCTRRAPAEQLARLERQRVWFHDRRRPPR